MCRKLDCVNDDIMVMEQILKRTAIDFLHWLDKMDLVPFVYTGEGNDGGHMTRHLFCHYYI